jgi:3-methyladenine DNA glycosylase AlkC
MAGLDGLELTARGWHIADVMHDHLPRPFAAAAEVLIASLGPELVGTEAFGLAPFRYLPHVCFVQKYGLNDFEPAMRAQYELTKRFSAEQSIRAFLVRYPDETYARLREWAGDGNVHVRRLVSEGTRPRLPWAPRLRAFQDDPRPVVALLERLKDDPERYVQRSVANSLNDIGKDHPDRAVEVCRRWSVGASPARLWIVRHALRALVKKGHRGALAALGVDGKPAVRIDGVKLAPRRIKLGDSLRFSFAIASTAKKAQDLLIDYAVHYVKANGATRPKVFKLRKLALSPGERLELGDTLSFKDLTTRRHYPGRHRLDLLINGIPHPLGEFDVRRQ